MSCVAGLKSRPVVICLNVLCGFFVMACSVLWTGTVFSQMARDGSLGQTPGSLAGPNYTIGVQNPAQQIHGNNLFHSFSDFNVNAGESATFTGPGSIANIINRVTGGHLSNVNGQIRSNIAGANLFLINPSGIVVGPNGSFSVSGSIHLSTADYLRLGSGNDRFYADLGKTSQLTSAPVTAFGFLGERSAGPITVQAGPPLAVGEGKAISLVGGDISIAGRTIVSSGGLVSVVSAGGVNVPPANIEVSPSPMFNPSSTESLGSISIEGATLQSSSNGSFSGAGAIIISGGKLVLTNTTVRAIGHGFDREQSFTGQEVIPKSGDVKIFASEGTIQGSSLITGVSGVSGNNTLSKIGGIVSGNIEFNGGALTISNSTMSTTPTADKAGVGSVDIHADGRVMLHDSKIAVDANTQSSTTDSGSITIRANDIQLLTSSESHVGTVLSTKSFTNNDPIIAGSVLLEAGKTIISRGATIQTVAGSGEGGNITFKAGDSIKILDNSTVVAGSRSLGNGGSISAIAPVIDIQGSALSAEGGTSNSSGFLVDASGGNLTLIAKQLVHLRNSRIATSAIGGAGSGGNITIDPDAVVVRNSQILAQAIQGKGGAIAVIAGILLVDPDTVIKADSQNQSLNGTVNIQAPLQQLSGAIAPLPQAFAVATNLYGQRCAAQKSGQLSSFVQGARDGIPPQPGDLIPSPLMLELDEASPNAVEQSSPSLAAIRLGLPQFEQTSHSSLTVFAGCRS